MKNPYLSLLKTAWRYAQQQKGRYLLIYSLFLAASIISAMNPLLYGWFINAVQEKGIMQLHYAWLYAFAILGLKLAEWAFHGPARVYEHYLAFHLSRNFLHELYHKTLHLPVQWHQDHHSGTTINRIRKAYEALKDFFASGFMYFYTLTKFVSSLVAMLIFSPVFGAVGVAIGALTVFLIFKFDKPYMKAIDEKNEKEHIVSGSLFDSLSNILTVITLRLEKRMEKSLLGKVGDIFPPFARSARINEWKWFTADMMVTLVYAITAVGYIYQHTRPGSVFMLGSLVTLLGFVNQFTSVFHDIAYQYTQVVQYNTDVQTTRFIENAYREQHLPEEGKALPVHWQTIDINHLSFSHAHEQTKNGYQGLQNVHLHLERGKKLAIIGESGSGKSTLLAVMRGLYNPQPGMQITVNNSIEVQHEALSAAITLFPQEPEIFENTIEHNITLGLPFTEGEITSVCQTASFEEVVNQLPKGLQSSIQEKGVNLSGGQKQRLALARGVLAAQTSDIVLLDEPTSSVDPKTEIQIYQKMFAGFTDKAVVSTLHRLYLLPYFDYVYIMDKGRVVDEGSFATLRKNSKVFNELWAHQAKTTDD
ncbi:MAG TPA: ABC transporter ATP-binding protein [Flavihumibacter sp.]|nr:ABC transporter ATP-binding protein [Flavihumibacter sp.]